MKYLMLFVLLFSNVACGDKSKTANEQKAKSEQNQMSVTKTPAKTQKTNQPKATTEMPNLDDYSGQCPKNWGLVEGASKAQVEKFIQNFIYVPENPTPMYSDINTFTQADGSLLLMAATYNMQDTIVDQEMATVFVADKMTSCGVRFRCASDSKTWVNTCD